MKRVNRPFLPSVLYWIPVVFLTLGLWVAFSPIEIIRAGDEPPGVLEAAGMQVSMRLP